MASTPAPAPIPNALPPQHGQAAAGTLVAGAPSAANNQGDGVALLGATSRGPNSALELAGMLTKNISCVCSLCI
jgi:hypothetical protein